MAAFPRFLLFYIAVFAAFGVASPFLPALLQQDGLTATALAVALASGAAIRLAAGPLGGRWADRAPRPKLVLTIFCAASAVVALAYGAAQGAVLLTIVSVMHAAVLAPVTPIADALATQASGKQFRYGWVRGAGSTAFVAATLVSGQAVGRLGLAAIIPLNAGLLALAAMAALALPGRNRRATGETRTRPSVADLLRVRGFVTLMLIASLVGGSHAMHDAFEVIRWRQAGMSSEDASILWSASVVSEVVVFVVIGSPLLKWLGPGLALTLSAAAGVVRWSAAALTASFPIMAVIEPLHGLTFAMLHLTCVTMIGRIVPTAMAATAQAFYGTVALGATGALVTLASGPLYGSCGPSAFWAMALLCGGALPLTLTLRLTATSGPSRRSEGSPR